MKARILIFWEKHPALFYGLILFLGFLFALQTPWALFSLLLLLHRKRLFTTCFLFLFPCYVTYHFYTFPPSGEEVEGIFYIHSIKKSEKFNSGWSYRGILKTSEGRIDCSSFSRSYYPPAAKYQIKGVLKKINETCYSLKSHESWKNAGRRLTLAAWRNHTQNRVKNYIKTHVPQTRSAYFLIGMVTGQLEDRVMKQAFNTLGLSHLMAISGLHFSLIALIFHVMLRLFLPHKVEALCMMFLLTLYLLFVGDTPSVLRAWIVVMVLLLGQLLERRSSALNALGVALCLSLLLNPLSAVTLSFQLSFLATAGILFLYSPCEYLLNIWLPKYPLSEVITKHWIWRHGYIGLSLLRSALALTVAIHITLLPLLLYTFHTVSINSFVYNLFFPFLATCALLFFILSIPLGHWGHIANGYYCDWILRITESPPVLFKSFHLAHFPPWLLAVLLTALLTVAILLKTHLSHHDAIAQMESNIPK